MDDHQGPVISGPMFPNGEHDREWLPQTRLRGTVLDVRPGRRGEEIGQVITIKLEDWEHQSDKLLHTEVELIFHQRSS